MNSLLTRDAENAGLIIKNLIDDSKIHRVATIKHPNKLNGWYALHKVTKTMNVLIYGNFETAEHGKTIICDDKIVDKKSITAYQRIKLKEKEDFVAQELRLTATKAQDDIKYQFDNFECLNAKETAYMHDKKLVAQELDANLSFFGLKIKNKNELVVPAYKSIKTIKDDNNSIIVNGGNTKDNNNNGFDNILTGFQTQNKDKKSYGVIKGSYYCIGEVLKNIDNDVLNNTIIFVGEGFATVASVYVSIKDKKEFKDKFILCVCSFGSNNLLAVYKHFHDKYANKNSRAKIVILVDDDDAGLKALYAVQSVDKKVNWTIASSEHKYNDFSDLYVDLGKEAVADRINSLKLFDNNALTDIVNKKDIILANAEILNNYLLVDNAIYYKRKNKKGDEEQIYLCDKIELIKLMFNNDKSYCVFKLFLSDLNKYVEVTIKENILADTKKTTSILSGYHFKYNYDLQNKMINYLKNLNTENLIEISTKIGWYKDSYVLPNFSNSDHVSYFGAISADKYKTAGTLDKWRINVAQLCSSSDILTTVLYASFASIITNFADFSFGLHIFGKSSTGKTTALKVASSIFGNYKNKAGGLIVSWDTTVAGLTQHAKSSNNSICVLDEMHKATAQSLSNIYNLINGEGRKRATISDEGVVDAELESWETVVLSSGEASVESSYLRRNLEIQGGERLRLIDIEVIDTVTTKENNELLLKNSKLYYGTAVRAFTQYIYDNKIDVINLIETQIIELEEIYKNISDGGKLRVLKYFAVMIVACNIAKSANCLSKDFNADACLKIYDKWCDSNGTDTSSVEDDTDKSLFDVMIEGWQRYFLDTSNDFAKFNSEIVGHCYKGEQKIFITSLLKNYIKTKHTNINYNRFIKNLQDKKLISESRVRNINNKSVRIYDILIYNDVILDK